ncbi:inter-alpha-trypsin inhibitor-like [Patiria miniata]|uniref:BPTI/Kunitz inhibitor domain-containing protein n=1 Tax=Patiria miniata TaxID=46514 RepID=A0A914A9M5_PATMI|nr:inter-alpha-trypsin inhibitor-like [Patiria miniata]
MKLSSGILDPRCNDPIVRGRCTRHFEVFGYNSLAQSCVSFIYGGCNGNGNRFETMEACRKKCQDIDPRCNSPIVTGRCKRKFQVFGHDPLARSCVSFIYGGCGGNCNRFETMEECRNTCQGI